MDNNQQRQPKPGFYKIMALAFLAVGAVLIWQALVRHEWPFWAFGIMTIVNAIMAGLKSLVPGETRR
jgi:hypothetical protein